MQHKDCVSLKILLENGKFTDCEFRVGTKSVETFRAHKNILATASPVFEAMFFGELKETHMPVKILDVEPRAFEYLLKYMYSVQPAMIQGFDTLVNLICAAHKYIFPDLVTQCGLNLIPLLTAENVWNVLELAKLFDLPRLIEECEGVILMETSAALKSPAFEDVCLDTVLWVFDQAYLNIASESELFIALKTWAIKECDRKGLDVSPESVQTIAEKAITKIRFNDFSFNSITDYKLLVTKEKLAELRCKLYKSRVGCLARPERYCIRFGSYLFNYPALKKEINFKFQRKDDTPVTVVVDKEKTIKFRVAVSEKVVLRDVLLSPKVIENNLGPTTSVIKFTLFNPQCTKMYEKLIENKVTAVSFKEYLSLFPEGGQILEKDETYTLLVKLATPGLYEMTPWTESSFIKKLSAQKENGGGIAVQFQSVSEFPYCIISELKFLCDPCDVINNSE